MTPETPLVAVDTEIARVRITPEKGHIKALIDLVSDIAEANAISKRDARRLDTVLEDIVKNVVRHGFEGDRSRPIEVIISRRLHALVVAVEEKGLPFDYDALDGGKDRRFASYISRHYADEVHFQSLGKGGNRTEIVKHLPDNDIRGTMKINEHHAHLQAPQADPNEPVTVGMLDLDQVHELVRLVFKCYGYTYANDFMYNPDKIAAMVRSGLMLSGVATNSMGEIVGHVGLIFSKAGARVAESGEAVTDPRYRGRGIFGMVKNYLLDYVKAHDVVGTYGECVTVHPYSQQGSIDLGGHETGFLLGYSPGTVKFEKIDEAERPRRQSVAMMFTPLAGGARESVYVPEAYAKLSGAIYTRLGFGRDLVVENDASGLRGRGDGRTSVSIRHDHNQAQIRIERIGRQTLSEVRFQLKHLMLERLDCIYADLPLKQKGAGYVASELRKLGFFFGCLIPEYADGDILRLQYLNNVEVERSDIKTASDFGEDLLDRIFNEMDGEANAAAA